MSNTKKVLVGVVAVTLVAGVAFLSTSGDLFQGRAGRNLSSTRNVQQPIAKEGECAKKFGGQWETLISGEYLGEPFKEGYSFHKTLKGVTSEEFIKSTEIGETAGLKNDQYDEYCFVQKQVNRPVDTSLRAVRICDELRTVDEQSINDMQGKGITCTMKEKLPNGPDGKSKFPKSEIFYADQIKILKDKISIYRLMSNANDNKEGEFVGFINENFDDAYSNNNFEITLQGRVKN